MARSSLAGHRAPAEMHIDVDRLIAIYYEHQPDVSDPAQQVSFGTSGHRGSSEDGSFSEAHILAIAQAIGEYRRSQSIDGPVFVGKDTHALSAPAEKTIVEVLAANGLEVVIQQDGGPTPTPVISHAILMHNHGRTRGLADGILLTPSHNPPKDGGIKYNPPHGGPADTDVTKKIQDRANELLREGSGSIKRLSYDTALRAATTHARDFVRPYIEDLASVIDFDCLRGKNLRLAVDPLGGASVNYWAPIAEFYGLNLTVVNSNIDPKFSFMPVDHDGQIRMDCSSRDAMAGLIDLKDSYDVAFGLDPDADRHGIVTPTGGLMNPNHYLAVAVEYLFSHRPQWPPGVGVGKTLVSSAIIDRVAAFKNRRLVEVPVGFKWFVPGLMDGTLGFVGEESAGATLLRHDATVWTTDKDGLVMCLLAAEITARSGQDPSQIFERLGNRLGRSSYSRSEAPATAVEKGILQRLNPEAVTASTLAGDPILAKHTHAIGNGAPIGGLKVITSNAWFAARPSGTENLYKIYAESFQGSEHLEQVVKEARQVVTAALAGS